MKKIRDWVRMACLFIRLVFEMLRNYFSLNDDMLNNFQVCKKICKKVVKSAKINLSIENQERIPQEKPFLLVSNHRCFFDVVFLLSVLDYAVSFVAAEELWHYPVLRKYLSSIQCIALDRYTKNVAKIKSGINGMKEALTNGNVVLFPEGECSYYDEEMHPFKKGSFLGVIGVDVNIVPAFIEIHEIRNIGRWMIPQGEVRIKVGDSFSTDSIGDGKKAAELAKYVQNKVGEMRKKS